MMNGLVIRRGKEYLARKTCKSTYADENGHNWSTELQAARVYMNHDTACRAARRVGGTVHMLKDGRVVE